MSQVIKTSEQQIYLSKLLGYDYVIQYKLGSQNIVADALSRILTPNDAKLYSLSMPTFIFLDQLQDTLLQDIQYKDLLDDVRQNPSKHPDLKVHYDLIFRNGKIWLPIKTPITSLLLQEFHSSPIGGHIGVAKTFHRLHQNFDWPCILEDVCHYVLQCVVCQQKNTKLRNPLAFYSHCLFLQLSGKICHWTSSPSYRRHTNLPLS